MPFDGTLALLVLGALLGGFVSGLAGFGGGPVVLVLWLLVIEPKVAVPLLMVSAVAHQVLTMHLIWKSITLRRLLPMAIGGLAATPVGAVLLGHLSPAAVRATAGAFLTVYTLTRLTYIRDLTLEVKTRWADAAAGAAAGIMNGLAGLPGPTPRFGAACAAGARLSSGPCSSPSIFSWWSPASSPSAARVS
jgi:uncharacterized protein